jgi:ElaB/YqjD/DUF883 family membrane-anchored ribosome-binding protein
MMEARKPKKARISPLAPLVDRAAAAAHDTIDDFQGRAERVGDQFIKRAEQSSRGLVKRAEGTVEKVTNYIEENPFKSVALAFGAAILATSMFRASGVDLSHLIAPPEDDDAA